MTSRHPITVFEKKIAGLGSRGLDSFVLKASHAAGLSGAVSVLITGNSSMRGLNARFRGKNRPTDVLSFPAASLISESHKPGKLAGDVAISADVAMKNSFRLGHPSAEEIKILALHGILHLAGFDHERDNGEMALMEAKLRRALRLPAALIERAGPERAQPARFPKVRHGKSRATTARRTA